MTDYQEVNANRERFIIYPAYNHRPGQFTILKGWAVYDKDTDKMVYNHRQSDGLYPSKENALIAAALWQRQN